MRIKEYLLKNSKPDFHSEEQGLVGKRKSFWSGSGKKVKKNVRRDKSADDEAKNSKILSIHKVLMMKLGLVSKQ